MPDADWIIARDYGMKTWGTFLILALATGGLGVASASGKDFLRCDTDLSHCRWHDDSGLVEHDRPLFPRKLQDSAPETSLRYDSMRYDRIAQRGGLVPSSRTVRYFGCNKTRQTMAGVVFIVGYQCWLIDRVWTG